MFTKVFSNNTNRDDPGISLPVFPSRTNLKMQNIFVTPKMVLDSVSYFFFLYRSAFSSLCIVFDSTSSNIDEVLSFNPFINVFAFGDFNVLHKGRLTYSGGTDRPGELCYIFSISNDLTQMVNFPSWIPDCDSHSAALLDFFLSSYASVCSEMAFFHCEMLIMFFFNFH